MKMKMKRKKKSRDAYRRVSLACSKCGRTNFLTSKGLAGHRAKCGGSGAHKSLSAGMPLAKARKAGKPRNVDAFIRQQGYNPKNLTPHGRRQAAAGKLERSPGMLAKMLHLVDDLDDENENGSGADYNYDEIKRAEKAGKITKREARGLVVRWVHGDT